MLRLFEQLSSRTCFTFAVAVFSVFGGQMAATVWFLFVLTTVDLGEAGTLAMQIVLIAVTVILATFFHYFLFGLSRVGGKSWELKKLRVLNDGISGTALVPDISDDRLLKITRQLERLPLLSARLSMFLSGLIVGIMCVAEILVSGRWVNAFGIFKGGLIACILYTIFAFTITERLTYDTRREARRLLAKTGLWTGPSGSIGIITKLGFFPVSIIISVLVAHDLIVSRLETTSHVLLFFFSSLLLLEVSVIALLVFHSHLRPLKEIEVTARELSEGRSHDFISGSIDHEFEATARFFHEASGQIVRYRDQLHSLNQALEIKVNERTNELISSNGRLQREVVERQQIETALRDSEQRFREMAELLPTVIAEYDLDLNITYANKIGLATFGLTPQDIEKGFNVQLVIPELELPKFWAGVEKIRNGESIGMMEYRLFKGDGAEMVALVNASAVVKDGEVVGGRLTLSDVTEWKRLENQVRYFLKMESLGVVAGGVAHDFNNLLMGIIGNVDLALMHLPFNSHVKDYLEQISALGHRAAGLSQQMLDYSGHGRVVTEPVNLSVMVEEMKGLLNASIPAAGHLTFHLDHDVPPTMADPNQIRQVIMNLATNAFEALAQGQGHITLTTGTRYCEKDFFEQTFLHENQEPGPYVFLKVTDTGTGLAPDTLERIFDPFFSTKFTGRGLGLAAVLGIVRGHKGAIKVDTASGSGASFTVFFPAAEQLPASRPATREKRENANTILLVDDEDHVLAVVKEMLELAGFAVITASDGVEGVRLYREKAGELGAVVLDLTMPRLNGKDAFKEMMGINDHIPIIAASGFSQEEAETFFDEQAPDAFISKPFQLQVLLDTIRQVMGTPVENGSQ